jgi:hypothetical protein
VVLVILTDQFPKTRFGYSGLGECQYYLALVVAPVARSFRRYTLSIKEQLPGLVIIGMFAIF